MFDGKGYLDTITDGLGKLICERRYSADNSVMETHYAYDLKDSLICVIQPEGMKTLKA